MIILLLFILEFFKNAKERVPSLDIWGPSGSTEEPLLAYVRKSKESKEEMFKSYTILSIDKKFFCVQ